MHKSLFQKKSDNPEHSKGQDISKHFVFGTGRFISGPCSEVDEVIAAHQAGPGSFQAPEISGMKLQETHFSVVLTKMKLLRGRWQPPRFGIAIMIIMFGTHPWNAYLSGINRCWLGQP